MQREVFYELIAELALTISKSQYEQLWQYVQLLRQWNQVYNLVSRQALAQLETHHLLDSLAVMPVLQRYAPQIPACSLIDLGSGAGLPGIPIAIVQPQWQVRCIDAVEKKVAFMRQARAVLALANLQAEHVRIQTGHTKITPAALLVSRAMSAVPVLAQLAVDCVMPGGHLVAMVGQAPEPETLTDKGLGQAWEWQATQVLQVPGLEVVRHAVVLQRRESGKSLSS